MVSVTLALAVLGVLLGPGVLVALGALGLGVLLVRWGHAAPRGHQD